LAAFAGVGVGLAVTLGWVLTYAISQASFEIVPVSTVTFTGPATDTLMALVTERSVPLSFGIGLVPGVFVGAGLPRFWQENGRSSASDRTRRWSAISSARS
jgi:hypothetical protein